MNTGHDERMRRWRLVLGEAGPQVPLGGADARIDGALGALYDSEDRFPECRAAAGRVRRVRPAGRALAR